MKNLKSYQLIISIIFLFVLGSGFRACDMLGSKAKGKLLNSKCISDVGLVKGETDYGVSAKIRVKNVGEAGIIQINPQISTSEGEWERNQKLTFNAGEEKELTYFFSEPTINVTNVECTIAVIPQ